MSHNSIYRIFSCIRHLGIRKGVRYWRMQNAAIKDPAMALRLAHWIRLEASHQTGGNFYAMMRYADEIAASYDRWNKEKS